MIYPFVASYVSPSKARGPRRAFVIHMAEGGGTVGYLSRSNPHGVSVHFVIEATGRTVQMLQLDQMHTSIRAADIRTSDDADGFFGATAARAVMGEWADIRTTLGPNHASIAVEIEGFAANGPNDKQKDALARLWSDLSSLYPGIRSLGHRDFADYKACPGRLIPWNEVGGHGSTTESPVRAFDVVNLPVGTLTIKDEGTYYLDMLTDTLRGPVGPANWPGGKFPILPVRLREPVPAKAATNTDDWKLGYIVGTNPAFVLERNVTVTKNDCSAIQAERDKARADLAVASAKISAARTALS